MTEKIQQRRGEFATRLIVRLAEHYKAKTNDALRELGFPDFNDGHKQVLFNLETDGNRITTLAQRARISVQAMGKLVRDLESKDYVVRAQDPTDGRAQIIRPSEKGLRFFEVAVEVIDENEREMEELLGGERFGGLREALRDVLAEVDADNF